MPGRPPKSQAVPFGAVTLLQVPVPGSQLSVVQSSPSLQSTTSQAATQAPPVHAPGLPPKSQALRSGKATFAHLPLSASQESVVQA